MKYSIVLFLTIICINGTARASETLFSWTIVKFVNNKIESPIVSNNSEDQNISTPIPSYDCSLTYYTLKNSKESREIVCINRVTGDEISTSAICSHNEIHDTNHLRINSKGQEVSLMISCGPKTRKTYKKLSK